MNLLKLDIERGGKNRWLASAMSPMKTEILGFCGLFYFLELITY